MNMLEDDGLMTILITSTMAALLGMLMTTVCVYALFLVESFELAVRVVVDGHFRNRLDFPSLSGFAGIKTCRSALF